MIQVIPSIAIKKGKVVKMRKGDPSSVTIYDDNPLDLAKKFEDHGIEVVHLIDLDGAEKGTPVNYHVLEAITGYTQLKVDFTGGISTDGDISKAFEFGAQYITAASIAITNPNLFSSWIISYGREKITLGADISELESETVLYRGWNRKAEIKMEEHILSFYNKGLKYLKSTVVSRDGVVDGPAFDYYVKLRSKFPDLSILASGGVRGIDDIKKLQDLGIFAVIFGKAFYDGILKIEDIATFLKN